MKYITKTISIISLLFLPTVVYAKKSFSDAGTMLGTVAEKSGTSGQGDVFGYVGSGIQAALALVGTIFFVLMFYGGIKWFTSRGEEQAITTAKNTVIAATIGLMIVLSSYAVTDLVTTRLVLNQGSQLSGTPATQGSGTTTPVGRLGCCIDATRDTPFGLVYTPYLPDENTCEARQGDDGVSGANPLYWIWFDKGVGDMNMNICNEILTDCYDTDISVDVDVSESERLAQRQNCALDLMATF